MLSQEPNPVELAFQRLFSQFGSEEIINSAPPLLAHYTDVSTAEKILTNDEFWMSNPLFMNDTQEIRFGVLTGAQMVLNSVLIEKVANGQERYDAIRDEFKRCFEEHKNNDVIDTYVGCFSEHKRENNNDGRLSMWRAYGSNGDGAAIVLNTKALQNQTDATPIVLSKVVYKSFDEQTHLLERIIQSWCEVLQANFVPDEHLPWASQSLFHLISFFSLTHKHSGFDEEEEWRLIYSKQTDPENRLESYVNYHNGSRGIEPKLKLKLKEIQFPELQIPNLSLEHLIDCIVLGPCISSELAKSSFCRMLKVRGKSIYIDKVFSSQIPFRNNFVHSWRN